MYIVVFEILRGVPRREVPQTCAQVYCKVCVDAALASIRGVFQTCAYATDVLQFAVLLLCFAIVFAGAVRVLAHACCNDMLHMCIALMCSDCCWQLCVSQLCFAHVIYNTELQVCLAASFCNCLLQPCKAQEVLANIKAQDVQTNQFSKR